MNDLKKNLPSSLRRERGTQNVTGPATRVKARAAIQALVEERKELHPFCARATVLTTALANFMPAI
jgi:hypothetical protein